MFLLLNSSICIFTFLKAFKNINKNSGERHEIFKPSSHKIFKTIISPVSMISILPCQTFRKLWPSSTVLIHENFYRPQTKLPEGNVLHLSVSHSVHRGVSVWCHFLSGYLVPCSFRGVCVQGGLWQGGLCSGALPWTETPLLYGKERAVGILLKCILASQKS